MKVEIHIHTGRDCPECGGTKYHPVVRVIDGGTRMTIDGERHPVVYHRPCTNPFHR
jgi:hypothetical protein